MSRFMKRFLCVFIAVLLLFCTGCSLVESVLISLPEYGSNEYYSYGALGDYTDFGIFHFDFPIAEHIAENLYFSQVGQDRDVILQYLENYEKWVETVTKYEDPTFSEHYTYDITMLDSEDWYFLDSKYENTDNYDLFLFDTQTNTLYFFHSNI